MPDMTNTIDWALKSNSKNCLSHYNHFLQLISYSLFHHTPKPSVKISTSQTTGINALNKFVLISFSHLSGTWMRHCSKRKKEKSLNNKRKRREKNREGGQLQWTEGTEKSVWVFFKEKGALQGKSLLKHCFVQKRIAFLQPAELDEIREEEKKSFFF